MVDEEAQQIRAAVIQAMEAQGEDIASFDDVSADLADAAAGSAALSTWEGVAVAAAEPAGDGDAPVDEAEVERAYLDAVFSDVRVRSAMGELVEPTRWPEAGLVPAHQTAEDWEMFVYEYLEARAAQREAAEAEAAAAAATPVVRTATCAVGVPRMLRREEPPAEAIDDRCAAESAAAPEAAEALSVEVEVELLEPIEPVCDDIVVLVGKRSYYLYSTERMTDVYARWAFLSREDDRVLTFVECVREESRTYPRPMEAASFANDPFNLAADEVAALWETVRDSGAYPDLDTVTASNGDVYYFSTEYLKPAYAASLAEWNSVERAMYL